MTLNGARRHLLVNYFPILGSQTGERAEQYLAAIHELNRAIFQQHEKAADLATIGMYLTRLLSGLMLVWKRTPASAISTHPCFCPIAGYVRANDQYRSAGRANYA